MCAEFAILRHFDNNPDAKAVYVTPMEDMANNVYFVSFLFSQVDFTVSVLFELLQEI